MDGYSGFSLSDKNCRPKVALHIENEMHQAMKKYQKPHPEQESLKSPVNSPDLRKSK